MGKRAQGGKVVRFQVERSHMWQIIDAQRLLATSLGNITYILQPATCNL
ncbi:hypothetical protein LYNGBM3L_17950 [Moorena producens 3L]|uniref:Uncharacterized protein n=1 Tax=Moorena producens 3L TaxID=489825 RepID=F4XM37_9CYAN|nr:hypothetical protein LYNGBM3L_17950 [Moorena producens 3L]